jgi:ABC-type transport system involved in multi-copper enzyme maturation permease subunit
MTAHGVLLVMGQEFRVRLRTGRWRWLLSVWVVVIGLFTGLLDLALGGTQKPHGIPLFGGLMLFVLGLILIISPALTAQSINGDRERGTLATLQVTRLTPAEIAVGKLLAAWGVGVGALALTLPFVGWALAEGGVSVTRAAVVLLVVILLVGVVCAISQALSALLARSITSALLSYVTMFALTVGTLVAFGLSAGVMSADGGDGSHKVWWMLAPNPFVVLADAAPRLPPIRQPLDNPNDGYVAQPADPLGEIGRSVRETRSPSGYIDDSTSSNGSAVWPYGLGFDLLLGVGALWLTIRRLHTPARALLKGVRVA